MVYPSLTVGRRVHKGTIFTSYALDDVSVAVSYSRSGELRKEMTTQSLMVLPLNLGAGQYIAMHATLTARDFFLANLYPSGPFTCIFPKPLPSCSCVSCG